MSARAIREARHGRERLRRLGKRATMTAPRPKIDPSLLGERLSALPGLDRVREAAAGLAPIWSVGRCAICCWDASARTSTSPWRATRSRAGAAPRWSAREPTSGSPRRPCARAASSSISRRPAPRPMPGRAPFRRSARRRSPEDLARRDFTVNAMAVPLAGQSELIDPHGGLGDLERRRAPRSSTTRSFVDDPTRALRAARYAARYGFTLEPATAERAARGRPRRRCQRIATRPSFASSPPSPRRRRGFALLVRMGPAGDWRRMPSSSSRRSRGASALPPWAGRSPPRGEAVLRGGARARVEEAGTWPRRGPTRPSEGMELARGRSGAELALARALGAEWLDRYVSEWRRVRLEIDGDDLLRRGHPGGAGDRPGSRRGDRGRSWTARRAAARRSSRWRLGGPREPRTLGR